MTSPWPSPWRRPAVYQPPAGPRRGTDLGKRDTLPVINTPALLSDGSSPYGNGFWSARWDPVSLPRVPFEIWHMAVRGPSGAALQLYVSTRLVSATSRASLNEWDPSQPIPVDPGAGESVIAYWNTAATPKPYLAFYMRSI